MYQNPDEFKYNPGSKTEVRANDPSEVLHCKYTGNTCMFIGKDTEYWGTVFAFDEPAMPFKIHIPTVMTVEEKDRMMSVLTELIRASVEAMKELIQK